MAKKTAKRHYLRGRELDARVAEIEGAACDKREALRKALVFDLQGRHVQAGRQKVKLVEMGYVYEPLPATENPLTQAINSFRSDEPAFSFAEAVDHLDPGRYPGRSFEHPVRFV